MAGKDDSGMSLENEIPTLYDALDKFVNSRLASIHTALPAKVLSYDKTKKVCSVKPLLKKELESGVFVEYPVIDNVPVMFQQTTKAIISLPIKVNDTVLLIFSERSIDDWKTKGGIVEPEDPRKFDISDAIAIPGLFPKSQGVAADEDDILIEHTAGNVKIKSSGDVILNAGTKGVARLDDQIKSTSVEDSAFWAFILAFSTWVVVPGDGGGALKAALTAAGFPTSLTGKITAASSTVKAGG